MKKMNLIVRDTLLTIGLMIAIGIILLLIATPVVLINNLVITNRGYIVIGVVSLVIFTASVIPLITQKRLLISSIMGLVAGVLFLASSIFGYKYGIYTNQSSVRFLALGTGIMLLSNGFGLNERIKNSLIPIAQVPKFKTMSLISILVGTMALLFYIYLVIN